MFVQIEIDCWVDSMDSLDFYFDRTLKLSWEICRRMFVLLLFERYSFVRLESTRKEYCSMNSIDLFDVDFRLHRRCRRDSWRFVSMNNRWTDFYHNESINDLLDFRSNEIDSEIESTNSIRNNSRFSLRSNRFSRKFLRKNLISPKICSSIWWIVPAGFDGVKQIDSLPVVDWWWRRGGGGDDELSCWMVRIKTDLVKWRLALGIVL